MKDRPILIPLGERDIWQVHESWTWKGYTIPKGFITDLDSIPYIPYIHTVLKGRARVAALLHDYLYHTGEVSRKVADKAFKELMEEEGVHSVYKHLIYRTIRLTGWVRWNELRRR